MNFISNPIRPGENLATSGAPCAESSAWLQSAEFGGQPNISVFESLAYRLAFERGQMRGCLNCTPADLFKYDVQISGLIDRAKSDFSSAPALLEQMQSGLREAYDNGILSELQRRVSELGQNIGICHGRHVDAAASVELRSKLGNYLEQHRAAYSGLWARYPELNTRIEELAHQTERQGVELRHGAEKAAIIISVALRKFWPDFGKLFEVLEKQSPQSRELVDQAFKQRYGKTILDDVRDTCSRPGLGFFYQAALIVRRTEHIMKDQKVASSADGIAHLLGGKFGLSFRTLSDRLSAFSPGEVSAIRKEFNLRYSVKFGNFENLGSRFRGHEAEIIEHLTRSRPVDADVVRLRQLLKGNRQSQRKLPHVLEKYEGQELAEVESVYRRRFGVGLRQAIEANVADVPVKERLIYWLDGKLDLNTGACLRSSILHLDSTPLAEYFLNLSPDERARLIVNYEKQYQTSLEEDIEQNLKRREFGVLVSRRDIYLAQAVIRTGQLSDEEAIYQCVDGVGTDVPGIKDILRHKHPDEIIALGGRFSELMKLRHGKAQDMFARLNRETSGDDWHDIQQLLLGWPRTPEAWVRRVIATHDHERSGLFRKVDLITREGPIMDRDTKALADYFERVGASEKLSPAQATRVQDLARIALRDCSAFRRTKNALANVFAQMTGALGSVGVIVGISEAGIQLHDHLVLVGLTILTTSTVLRLTVKNFLKGKGYGGEEKIMDFVSGGLVDGFAPVLARFSPGTILRRALNVGAKIGGRTAIARVREVFHKKRISMPGLSVHDLDPVFSMSDAPLARSNGLAGISNRTRPETVGTCSTHPMDERFERLIGGLVS